MKDCKFCDKTGLLVQPLRYAVVAGYDPKALEAVAKLPGTLGAGVTDISLTNAKYAVRMLREGFLYVLTVREIEGKTIEGWTGYAVIHDAFLYQFDVKAPPSGPIEFSCDRDTCGVNASCVAFPHVENVKTSYWLFTPSVMTVAKLAEYRREKETFAKNGKLQEFNPKAWAKTGATSQTHSLKPEQLGNVVVEWQLYKQCKDALSNPLGIALTQHLFPANSCAYAGVPAPAPGKPPPGRLGQLQYQLEQQKGAAFVLFDAIGITQELNDFRNAPFDLVNAFLATADKAGITNQRKLEVSQAIEDMQMGFQKGLISSEAKWLDMHRQSSDRWHQQRLETAQMLRAQGRGAEAQAIEDDVARGLKVREINYTKAMQEAQDNGPKEWQSKYGERISQAEIDAFKANLRSITHEATKGAQQRGPDHLKWLASEPLLKAMDTYDKASLGSGFEFAMHYTVCTDGLTCTAAGEQQVSQWVGSTEAQRRNLYLRAFAYNQTDLETQVSAMLKEVHQQADAVEDASLISGALMLKAAKGVVDSMKKIDSAWDEWLRDGKVKSAQQGQGQPPSMFQTLSKWHKGMEGRTFKWVSELTQVTSRAAMGNPIDKRLVAVGAALIYSRMGELTEKITFDTVMLKIPPAELKERKQRRAALRAANKQQAVSMKAAAPFLEDPLADLLDDARLKAKNQVKLGLDELGKGERPPTNNYHQVRLGALLAGIEAIALANKLPHFSESPRAKAEVIASLLSIGAIFMDMQYALAKSIREIEPFKSTPAAKTVLRSLDAIRGGYKLAAGVLSTGAGAIAVILDFSKGFEEWNAKDKSDSRFLAVVYFGRGLVSVFAVTYGALAAFSYSAEWFAQLPKTGVWRRVAIFGARSATMEVVDKLVFRRTLLLIRVARLNLIGLALTVVEIGWLLYRDNKLQNWFDASTFRANKGIGIFSPKPFDTLEGEMEALQEARAEVGL
jgi:hypothetical protein